MTCALHNRTDCGCYDLIYAGIVIVDDPDQGGSEPGSWARHIRDTEPMRNPEAPCHNSSEGVHSASAALSGEGL